MAVKIQQMAFNLDLTSWIYQTNDNVVRNRLRLGLDEHQRNEMNRSPLDELQQSNFPRQR